MRLAEFAPVAASLNALQNVTWVQAALRACSRCANR
jgi:hypothetical protein